MMSARSDHALPPPLQFIVRVSFLQYPHRLQFARNRRIACSMIHRSFSLKLYQTPPRRSTAGGASPPRSRSSHGRARSSRRWPLPPGAHPAVANPSYSYRGEWGRPYRSEWKSPNIAISSARTAPNPPPSRDHCPPEPEPPGSQGRKGLAPCKRQRLRIAPWMTTASVQSWGGTDTVLLSRSTPPK